MRILYMVDGLELIQDVHIEPGLGLSRGPSFEVDALCVFLYHALPIGDVYFPALLWAEGGLATKDGFALLDRVLEALHLFAAGRAQPIARFWVNQPQWDDALRTLQEPDRLLRLMDGGEERSSVYTGAIEAAGVTGHGELVMHTVLPGTEPIRLDCDRCEKFPSFWKRWKSVDKARIQETLNAFKRAWTVTPEMKISALVQCLESLLSEGPGDLKHKVALRAAFLLEPLKSERPRVFRVLKKSYDVRSDVVHGKPMRDVEKDLRLLEESFGEPLDRALAWLEERARSLIRRIALSREASDRGKLLEAVDCAILSGGSITRLLK